MKNKQKLPAWATMKPVQYNFVQGKDEFVVNPSGEEHGDITGNRVFVTGKGSDTRFNIQIDDFGDVLAALNRLIVKFIPTFVFPKTKELENHLPPS